LAEGGLIKGSFWISLKAMICQLISRVLDPSTPFALVVDDGTETEVIERLLRIGFNNILGYNGFNMKEWKGETFKPLLRTYETIESTKKTLFIDVRNKPEWEEGGVFENALLLALPDLKKSKIDLVIKMIDKHPEADVIVHCKTGMRARLATSILCNHLTCQISVLNEVFEKLPEKGAKFVPYKAN
jgi:hydroxyacylglutathione hydrolase